MSGAAATVGMGMVTPRLWVAALAGVSAVLLVLGVGALRAARARAARLGPLPAPPRRRRRRHPRVEELGARLRRAGVPIGPMALLGATALGAAAASAATAWILGLPMLAPGAGAAVVGGAVSLVAGLERRRSERVAAQLPPVSRQLAAALGAGLSLRQALERAGRDTPDPAGIELRRIATDLAVGARVEEALEGWLKRQPGRDLQVLVAAIAVQRSTGGDLAAALARLADRLEERSQLAREVRGATAQARMTAWLVAALPLGGGVITELVAPGTLAATVGRGPGAVLLLIAVGLYAIGLALVRRIGRVEV